MSVRPWRRYASAALLSLVAGSGAMRPAFAAEAMKPFDGATPAPFVLEDLAGEPVALDSLRGRVVLLNFWATWCGPCVKELPSMQRLAERLADESFELVAVNMGETPATATAFLERLGIAPSFTVVVDGDGTATRDWGVFAYPSTFLLDPDGRAVRVRYGGAEWDSPEVVALIESVLSTEGPSASGTSEARSSAARTDAAEAGSAGSTTSVGPVELGVPARPGAREPNLVLGSDGVPVLSWMEPVAGAGIRLRTSRLVDGAWDAPSTVATGADWFVNWADFPSLVAFGNGELAAWWPVVNGADPYAYDLNLATSGDGGVTWGAPTVPHDDGTPTQHGFVAMAPSPDGGLLVAWLDGRINAVGADPGSSLPLPTADMTLRAASIEADGTTGETALLDDRVCTCCGVDAVRTGDAVLVAYRDRSGDEVRDISLVRRADGAWSEPYALHADGWTIAGCPVNGPALAADDHDDANHVVAAWFTAANDVPMVRLARSMDGGRTFAGPVRIDAGRPVGRVDVVLLDGGDAVVSWLESTALGEELRYRRVARDGTAGEPVTLARSGRGRTMGFPRALRVGGRVLFAWTQPAGDGPLAVRTASVDFPDTRRGALEAR